MSYLTGDTHPPGFRSLENCHRMYLECLRHFLIKIMSYTNSFGSIGDDIQTIDGGKR